MFHTDRVHGAGGPFEDARLQMHRIPAPEAAEPEFPSATWPTVLVGACAIGAGVVLSWLAPGQWW